MNVRELQIYIKYGYHANRVCVNPAFIDCYILYIHDYHILIINCGYSYYLLLQRLNKQVQSINFLTRCRSVMRFRLLRDIPYAKYAWIAERQEVNNLPYLPNIVLDAYYILFSLN